MNKLIVILLVLVAIKASALDTNTAKYFPLAVGNVYKYHYGASNGYQYDYKVRIVKDTIIGSKKYFIANQYFPGSIGQIIRMDSISGNIYSRQNSEYCSYSPFEVLVDSLRARKGDTTLVCTYYTPKHYCADTGFVSLLGNQVKRKVFHRYTMETSTSITYGLDFGIIFATYSDFWGIASESLQGCCINGVLYGDTILTDVKNITAEVPLNYLLSQNYPNPFNPRTAIRFSLPVVIFSSLKIFDITGNEVQTLVNERLQAGTYVTTFDGSGLNSGVYFYRLQTESYTETKRMILMK
ncbi:MAG: T9SS type A sorting domain-containing protein [Candidatus Kapaibacterium sp.]